MSYGDGCIWSGANGVSVVNHPNPPVNGIFQTDTTDNPAYQRPGWSEPLNSPYGGYIFRIDFI